MFLASYEEAQVALANVEGGMVVVIASVEADPGELCSASGRRNSQLLTLLNILTDVLNSLAKELGASVNKIAG